MTRAAIPGLAEVLAADVYEHAFEAVDREVGGVLVGETVTGRPPTVVGSIRALNAAQEASQITFTQDAWAHIHRVLDADFPSSEIVGWYHTHPGYGLFLSEQDLFIHRNFFGGRSQIAVVIDPVAGEEAVFAWHGEDVREYSRGPCAHTRGAHRLSRRRDRSSAPGDDRSAAGAGDTPSVSPLLAGAGLADVWARATEGRPAAANWVYVAAIVVSWATIIWELLLR